MLPALVLPAFSILPRRMSSGASSLFGFSLHEGGRIYLGNKSRGMGRNADACIKCCTPADVCEGKDWKVFVDISRMIHTEPNKP